MFFLAPLLAVPPANPCQPTPCGPYSQCKVSGGSPSCSCLPEYIGVPPNCRPECVSNSECASHLACINQKCKDPCPGICGINAECHVVSHTPQCVCSSGFTGDPFRQCTVPGNLVYLNCKRTKIKFAIKSYVLSNHYKFFPVKS